MLWDEKGGLCFGRAADHTQNTQLQSSIPTRMGINKPWNKDHTLLELKGAPRSSHRSIRSLARACPTSLWMEETMILRLGFIILRTRRRQGRTRFAGQTQETSQEIRSQLP
jgi:hypothetical protein